MLSDIEKFIYKDKIYSKCNESEKEMIDTCIHGVRQQIETFKDAYNQAQEEIALLKRENKALADDNELKCDLNAVLNRENKGLEKLLNEYKQKYKEQCEKAEKLFEDCELLRKNIQYIDIDGNKKMAKVVFVDWEGEFTYD